MYKELVHILGLVAGRPWDSWEPLESYCLEAQFPKKAFCTHPAILEISNPPDSGQFHFGWQASKS